MGIKHPEIFIVTIVSSIVAPVLEPQENVLVITVVLVMMMMMMRFSTQEFNWNQ